MSLNRFLSTGRARRKHRIAHTTTGAAQPGTIVGTVYTTGSTTTRRQAPTHPLFSTNARSTRQTYVIFGICYTLCAYLRKYTICKKKSFVVCTLCLAFYLHSLQQKRSAGLGSLLLHPSSTSSLVILLLTVASHPPIKWYMLGMAVVSSLPLSIALTTH